MADDPHPSPQAFSDPWEARAFAMVKALQEGGVLTREEWAQALGREIRRGGDADETAASYRRHWLAALERVVVDKRLASGEALVTRRAAWQRAAQRTPHGEPIRLAAGDH
ncbi:nitrile hydratase accessory protein [Mycobacterium sp. NPDC050551]|uniref:nitrile hydratase accessory protein n=1 Tax=Mycobacterium sp. NPDC050551 TaxID=3155407 RepID=UPI0034173EEE